MTAVIDTVARLAGRLAEASARQGRKVMRDPHAVLDRSADIALRPPGLVSPNGSCRLLATADGWIAVNLPREDDRALVSAWLGTEVDGDPWDALTAEAAHRKAEPFVAAGSALGLAVAHVGEVAAETPIPPALELGRPSRPIRGALDVVDLSSLWAGPLCGGILAEMGHNVTKIESVRRPDPTPRTLPALDAALNRGKTRLALDFDDPEDLAGLRERIARSAIVITSARPRAFAALGLSPRDLFAANPALIWVAITGHGWFGEAGSRVGFGDDAAAAGGLLVWSGGVPRFAGDALADPVTGLASAVAALDAIACGGGVLIDAALSRCAAGLAHAMGPHARN